MILKRWEIVTDRTISLKERIVRTVKIFIIQGMISINSPRSRNKRLIALRERSKMKTAKVIATLLKNEVRLNNVTTTSPIMKSNNIRPS